MSDKIADLVSAACGECASTVRPLSSSWGMRLYRSRLAGAGAVLIKHGVSQVAGHLAIEGFMLRELASKTDLPVPEVFYVSDDLLVMEFVESVGAMNRAHQHHAGELVAACHNLVQESFGYGRDTVIGALLQPNRVSQSWVRFFRDHRLLYMARMAHERGRLSAPMLGRIERLAGRLGQYIDEPDHPSLLHGDLWGGNILPGAGGKIAGFIDPAIYCGAAEIELAFTQMFHTFNEPFFDSYRANAPLAPDFFELRCDLYNLYPTLVHVALFGASYLGQVEAILRRVGL